MEKVAVLMSTYNGEKYLSEQIDSILAQESVSIDLFIRDDGSRDGTVNIIEQYSEQNDNVHYIVDGKHYGPGNSFMQLLRMIGDYEYYAFSDQDDIWKPLKLKVAIEKIRCNEIGKPCLYWSNQIIYKDGIEHGLRFKKEPRNGLAKSLISNIPSGCTMVFNHELRCHLGDNKSNSKVVELRMHDAWVNFIAILIGDVIYDHESYIDYRIHDNNTVGVPEQNNPFHRFSQFYERLKGICYRIIMPSFRKKAFMKTIIAILENVDDIQANDKELLIDYVNYQQSFQAKMKLLLNQRIRNEMGIQWWGFAMRVLLNYL